MNKLFFFFLFLPILGYSQITLKTDSLFYTKVDSIWYENHVKTYSNGRVEQVLNDPLCGPLAAEGRPTRCNDAELLAQISAETQNLYTEWAGYKSMAEATKARADSRAKASVVFYAAVLGDTSAFVDYQNEKLFVAHAASYRVKTKEINAIYDLVNDKGVVKLISKADPETFYDVAITSEASFILIDQKAGEKYEVSIEQKDRNGNLVLFDKSGVIKLTKLLNPEKIDEEAAGEQIKKPKRN